MRITTILAAGTLAAAGIGVARLLQEARHQKQRNEVALASMQITWLSQVSTNGDLAAIWKPAGLDVPAYQRMMTANRMLCQLTLRHRLGFVSERQLHFFASKIGENEAVREYLKRFGSLRAEEAAEDRDAAHFTAVLIDAAQT
ncbi:DUF6082 family protein [Streptomyces microflavus]|uniref:DUF6082 family protein n=1 Tax=Streptomyces microflavus TaxID=1919 RepID=UPI0033BA27E1